MHNYINLNMFDNTDLNMYHCGIEECEPLHSYGPAVRDHFLIHYILEGKGIFQYNGQTYRLEKGNGFLICPDVVTFYQADPEAPWTYTWVGFHGLKAEYYLKCAGLSMNNPIFKYDRDKTIGECLRKMVEANKLTRVKDTMLLSLLYLFLSKLIENADTSVLATNRNKKEFYAREVVRYIEANYQRKISISGISKILGLDRSYLGLLFKSYYNVSPQEFLLSFRMNKACGLLENPELSIGDVSRSVGYEDQLVFSKMFKRAQGTSPSEYRKNSTSSTGI